METPENWGPYLYDLLLKSQYLKQCLKKKIKQCLALGRHAKRE